MCPRKARSFSTIERQLKTLFYSDEAVTAHCVIDGVRGKHALEAIAGEGLETLPLFPTDAEPELRALGPRLVALNAPQALDIVFPLVWGWSTAIFCAGRGTTETVADRLKSLLFAEMPDGELTLMRFYDPRAFHRILDALDAVQAAEFFGRDIDCYALETGRAELRVVTRDEVLEGRSA
jgi:hypothetical protein